MLSQGPEVEKFEGEFSKALVGGLPVVAVNSGTSGLHLGLLNAGLGPGDEVIVPSFTFAATANAVALTGATPVFCDISPETFCLDSNQLPGLLTDRTKAIIPVHLFGHPADMPDLIAIGHRHGVEVVEDAAQAHGATVDGRPVGSFGMFGVFSLYPTKNMTSGEGGMVSCRDNEFALGIRLLRNQGMQDRYLNEIVGFNNRMSDIHAAIGRVQLGRLEDWTNRRIANAGFYNRHIEGVEKPFRKVGYRHVYHQYTIRVPEDRDGFATALENEYQIGSGHYYPVPVHQLKPFRNLPPRTSLTHSERATQEVLSLPIHPGLSRRQLEKVVHAVNEVAHAGG